MARLSRIVIPHVAHHLTQRGNRRLPVFFTDADRQAYLELGIPGTVYFGIPGTVYLMRSLGSV
jgi:putative transposase